MKEPEKAIEKINIEKDILLDYKNNLEKLNEEIKKLNENIGVIKIGIKEIIGEQTRLEGKIAENQNYLFLHCTSNYPAEFDEVNLLSMLTMQEELRSEVGYSDHTIGIVVPIAATSLGASVIEKHFTLDRKLEGPDHKASLEPEELNEMVLSVRAIEEAMGNGEKSPTESELETAKVARKSITSSTDIKKGQVFTSEMISIRRPGTGIPPFELETVIGKKAKLDIDKDSLISHEMIE